MRRPTRIELDGALYYVMSRRLARMPVLLDDTGRVEFLGILGRLTEGDPFVVRAICLMPNHYHLLCETPGGELVRRMRDLNGRYAQWFNRRHRRVGHLRQARYNAILV